MQTDEIETMLRNIFGQALTVGAGARTFFQVFVPIFMSDGDGAEIYVRPAPRGEFAVTDLGMTRMRLSYSTKVGPNEDSVLRRLASPMGSRSKTGSSSQECLLRSSPPHRWDSLRWKPPRKRRFAPKSGACTLWTSFFSLDSVGCRASIDR